MPDLEENFGPAPKKKSNTLKILLGCAGVAVIMMGVLGYCGSQWLQGLQDPVKVRAIAQGIAGTDVPEGFVGEFGVSLGFMEIASLANSNDGHILILGRAGEEGMNTMEQQLQQQLEQQMNSSGAKGELVGEVEFDVSGATAKFQKHRHESGGRKVLQYTGRLPDTGGKSRTILYLGPEEMFDEERLKNYLASFPAIGK